ncbi:hypothetical protein TRAPUB_11935 [Trametes pubescens]|uniref:Uncharacterized protein n=1 Tax=Trametes pubescens TaxID=154538 RepID=A0A1M2VV79_TRAPU|nr:hypothetical protein TRAPUB_11935 [Trametes pubescens]
MSQDSLNNVYQVDTISMSEAATITSSDSVQLHTGVACELCPRHELLLTTITGLRSALLASHEREAKAHAVLASTDYLLDEFVAVFRSTQDQCKLLEVEVAELRAKLANTYISPRLSEDAPK